MQIAQNKHKATLKLREAPRPEADKVRLILALAPPASPPDSRH